MDPGMLSTSCCRLLAQLEVVIIVADAKMLLLQEFDEDALRALMEEYAPVDMMLVTSAGYQEPVEALARDYPDVQFVQVYDYVMKDPTDRPNLHSIWSTLYEARYLAGVVAGGVLPKDENQICFIKAWDNAEVSR